MIAYSIYTLGNLKTIFNGILHTEKWVDIVGYEEMYQISSFGRVKSLSRLIDNKRGGFTKLKTRVLKQAKDEHGYLGLSISKEADKWTFKTHTLVWDYFGEGKRNGVILTIDHIDNNKENNFIRNLQLLTYRDNVIKSHDKIILMTGVYMRKKTFRSRIYFKGKYLYLGSFKTELEAHNAYLKRKNEIDRLLC